MRKYLYLLALTIGFYSPAKAEAPIVAHVLSAPELSAQVGGLRTPNGIDFTFGAVVTTYVNGKIALQSQLNWTDHGTVRAVLASAPAGDPTRQAAAVAGITLNNPTGAGVFVPGDHGGTFVSHALASGAITSLILNTADNRDIRQDTVITLNLPNLEQLKASAAAHAVQARVQSALNQALTTGH